VNEVLNASDGWIGIEGLRKRKKAIIQKFPGVPRVGDTLHHGRPTQTGHGTYRVFGSSGSLGSILGVLPSMEGEGFGLARPSLGKAQVELAGPACAFGAGTDVGQVNVRYPTDCRAIRVMEGRAFAWAETRPTI
jgi:hypothetical protein